MSETQRLDAFTDASFAFALSLLVIGQGKIPTRIEELRAEMADVPAFAIGFAMIAMFWFAHVRWRSLRGKGGPLSVLLTLMLIFVVLIYVKPLQAMALSLSAFLGGSGTRFEGGIAPMFFIYSGGFAVMSFLVGALFLETALQRHPAPAPTRILARGEAAIWLLISLTGVVSMLLAVSPYRDLAPWVYALLPLLLGLFIWRYPWPDAAPAS
ncbi:MAG: hypothetical protein ABS48_01310 [Erythrobacter sp. SCN 68-10]|nr:MAG: hypothetical protein ABS48_01310 [Erythrobacter sp. SCN 68-10]